jgi:CBS-domain-containing membrane protein
MTSEEGTPKARLEDYERALQSMGKVMDIFANDLMAVAERAQYFASLRMTESIKVSSVMSQPVHVIHQMASMTQAAQLLVNERISGMPVVDESESLVGIITEADFLRGVGLPSHHPTFNIWQTLESMFSHLNQNIEFEGPDDRVEEHMERHVVCASTDDDVEVIIGLMKQHRIKRIVVCNDRQHVLGMVTRSDLVRVFFDRYLTIKARR